MTHPTIAQIRTALRGMKTRQEIRDYMLTRNAQEIHVLDHCVNGTIRNGWTLYGYTNDACIGLMLGTQDA